MGNHLSLFGGKMSQKKIFTILNSIVLTSLLLGTSSAVYADQFTINILDRSGSTFMLDSTTLTPGDIWDTQPSILINNQQPSSISVFAYPSFNPQNPADQVAMMDYLLVQNGNMTNRGCFFGMMLQPGMNGYKYIPLYGEENPQNPIGCTFRKLEDGSVLFYIGNSR